MLQIINFFIYFVVVVVVVVFFFCYRVDMEVQQNLFHFETNKLYQYVCMYVYINSVNKIFSFFIFQKKDFTFICHACMIMCSKERKFKTKKKKHKIMKFLKRIKFTKYFN